MSTTKNDLHIVATVTNSHLLLFLTTEEWAGKWKQKRRGNEMFTYPCCTNRQDIEEKTSKLGIYTGEVVYTPDYYQRFFGMPEEDLFPIYNLVWIGLCNGKKGLASPLRIAASSLKRGLAFSSVL